jgi:hypothetical protein
MYFDQQSAIKEIFYGIYSILVDNELAVSPEKESRIELMFQLFQGKFHYILSAIGHMCVYDFICGMEPIDFSRVNRDKPAAVMNKEGFFILLCCIL